MAWENSSVEAWDNSRVAARDNSRVEARGNSSVEARENVGVHNFSPDAHVVLWGYCVVWLLNKSTAILKSKTARKITPVLKERNAAWFEREGIEVKDGCAILFKRVSKDFKTQEGTANETYWKIGERIVHSNPKLKEQEVGAGKFHFCSRPYFGDQFRSEKGDKYIALSVPIKTIHAWPNPDYPHKIGGTEAIVLYECDKFGKKL